MIDYNLLKNVEIKTIHNAFVNAFSDYQVKIDLPLVKFQNMLTRRGYTPKISMGAFDNNELVGFVLNGLRNYNGKLTAYDLGTGVAGSYRKQGITSNLIKQVKKLLVESEVSQYQLEVIKTNTSAFELYKKSNFEIVRELECFILNKSSFSASQIYDVKHIDKIHPRDWKEFCEFWDFNPSWQNSADSINAVHDLFCYSVIYIDNTLAGYGIIERKTGDIAQIAVNKNFRRKGIASSIIADLINNTESDKIAILNVDSECSSLISFLYEMGFEHHLGQYEMMLTL